MVFKAIHTCKLARRKLTQAMSYNEHYCELVGVLTCAHCTAITSITVSRSDTTIVMNGCGLTTTLFTNAILKDP